MQHYTVILYLHIQIMYIHIYLIPLYFPRSFYFLEHLSSRSYHTQEPKKLSTL